MRTKDYRSNSDIKIKSNTIIAIYSYIIYICFLSGGQVVWSDAKGLGPLESEGRCLVLAPEGSKESEILGQLPGAEVSGISEASFCSDFSIYIIAMK